MHLGRKQVPFTRKWTALILALPMLIFSATSANAVLTSHHATRHVSFPGTLTVSFPVPTATQDYTLYLARDQGIFAKYGLNVNVEVVGAATIDAALESGAIQITLATAPGLELAFQAGVPIKLIGMSAEHSPAFLTVRPNITSISQLAGKAVGSSAATSASTIQIKWALHTGGVPPTAVTYIPVTSASAVGALVSGEVNATSFNIQEIRQAQAALPGVHTLFNFIRMTWPSGEIWGYVPWMSTHKAETIAFLKAFNAAITEWNSNTSAADHEISIYAATSSPSTIAELYSGTQGTLNKGKVAIHIPSTTVEQYINKVLRTVGFPTAYNSYAKEGQEWTPTYWNAAFGKK